jgi:hypothetical protein
VGVFASYSNLLIVVALKMRVKIKFTHPAYNRLYNRLVNYIVIVGMNMVV